MKDHSRNLKKLRMLVEDSSYNEYFTINMTCVKI